MALHEVEPDAASHTPAACLTVGRLSLRRYFFHLLHPHRRRVLSGRCLLDFPHILSQVCQHFPVFCRILHALTSLSHLPIFPLLITTQACRQWRTLVVHSAQCNEATPALLPVSLPVLVRFVLSDWEEVTISSYAYSSFEIHFLEPVLFAHTDCSPAMCFPCECGMVLSFQILMGFVVVSLSSFHLRSFRF